MRQYPMFSIFSQAEAALIYMSQRLARNRGCLWVQRFKNFDRIWLG